MSRETRDADEVVGAEQATNPGAGNGEIRDADEPAAGHDALGNVRASCDSSDQPMNGPESEGGTGSAAVGVACECDEATRAATQPGAIGVAMLRETLPACEVARATLKVQESSGLDLFAETVAGGALRAVHDQLHMFSGAASLASDLSRATRPITDLYSRLGLRDLGGVSRKVDSLLGARSALFDDNTATRIARQLRPMTELADAVGRLSPFASQIAQARKQLTLPESLVSTLTAVQRVGASQDWFEQIASFARLGDHLRNLSPSLGNLESVLARTALPSVATLDALRPLGIDAALSFANGVDRIATMSWLRPEPAVALVGELKHEPTFDAEPRELIIHTRVQCAFCGRPMVNRDEKFSWLSATDLQFDLEVVPLCGECTKRSNDDPNYIAEKLAEFVRPMLRVLPGGCDGDGEPSGCLHLVADDRGDDDGGPPPGSE